MGVSNYTPTGISHATSVDFSKRSVNQPVHIVQYDRTLPILAVSLYNNGQLYRLNETMDVSIRLGKPDRTFVYNKALGCDSTRTIVYFEITQQMSVFDGEYYPVIEIKDGEKIANSSTIYLVVDRNPVQNDYIESTTEYKELVDYRDEALKASNEAKESANTAKDSAQTASDKASEAKEASKTAVAASETAVDASNKASESAKSILGVEDNVTRIGDMVAEKEPIILKAAETASTSATNAKASEEASKLSETNAKDSENKAKASEEASKLSETNAKASENASKLSETNAKASENASKLSETNAKASENASKLSETNAKAYLDEISKKRVLLIPKGDWNADTTYTGLDWVRHNGAAWVCKNTCTNVEPTEANSDNWQLMARDGKETEIDDALSLTSTNPVQNKVVTSNLTNLKYGEVAGGKNLFKNYDNYGVYEVATETYNGNSVIYSSQDWNGAHQSDLILKKGKTYAISAYVKGSGRYFIYCDPISSGQSVGIEVEKDLNSEWTKITKVYTPNFDVRRVRLEVRGGSLYISCFQIEEGTQATDYEPYIPSVKMLEEKADKSETTVNLLKSTLQTTTENGVTCTNNGDGTYTLNGTATSTVRFQFGIDDNLIVGKTYKALGIPISGSFSTVLMGWDNHGYFNKDGRIDKKTSEPRPISMQVISGYTCDNLVFKPMITTNLNATYDDFVPYTGDTGKLNGDVAALKAYVDKAATIFTYKTKAEYDAAVANDEIPDGATVIKDYDD